MNVRFRSSISIIRRSEFVILYTPNLHSFRYVDLPINLEKWGAVQ